MRSIPERRWRAVWERATPGRVACVIDDGYAAPMRGGIFYYNSADPSLFADKYLFNFANKWLYVFLVCLLCLPLLMFLPMLNS